MDQATMLVPVGVRVAFCQPVPSGVSDTCTISTPLTAAPLPGSVAVPPSVMLQRLSSFLRAATLPAGTLAVTVGVWPST